MQIIRKSLYILGALALGAPVLNAQTTKEAFLLSQQYQEGTARSVAMGNAFTALGGDLGALTINPASSGVYRYSEVSITPSVSIHGVNATYLGNNNKDTKTRFGVSNFGYVGAFNTGRHSNGLINWNLGVVYNKMNNLSNRMSVYGRTNKSSLLSNIAQQTNGINSSWLSEDKTYNPFFDSDAPWSSILAWNTFLIDNLPDSGNDYFGATENLDDASKNIYIAGDLDQHFTRESTGNVSEAVINFGGNISNKLFFGVNLGIQSIYYDYKEMYSENAVNSANFNSGFQSFTHRYHLKTSGTGINLKFGLIYLPFNGLRIGASISTPTWMYLQDKWEETMHSRFSDGEKYDLESPLGVFDYRLNSPFRWNVGVAYTFGKIGVISADYERVDYSQMKFANSDGNNVSFVNENRDFKQYYKSSDIFRAGLELKPLPEFAFRLGYQYYSNGEKAITNFSGLQPNNTLQLGSVGVGFISNKGFFADIAYQQKLNKDENNFYLGNGESGIEKPINYKIMLTLGFKF